MDESSQDIPPLNGSLKRSHASPSMHKERSPLEYLSLTLFAFSRFVRKSQPSGHWCRLEHVRPAGVLLCPREERRGTRPCGLRRRRLTASRVGMILRCWATGCTSSPCLAARSCPRSSVCFPGEQAPLRPLCTRRAVAERPLRPARFKHKTPSLAPRLHSPDCLSEQPRCSQQEHQREHHQAGHQDPVSTSQVVEDVK